MKDLKALPVVALHPHIAADYRRQVLALNEDLQTPERREKAVPLLRSLISSITIMSAEDMRGVEIKAAGCLRAIIALATGGGALAEAGTVTLERVKGIEPSS